ncbi:Heat shock 70 kDa protein 12B [Colletotrichum higginsianum]|uniref:Heat shock 70 kDa protein 12B n=1 Tax=Colletotrichum higginsianum TaxID=80884 RepID=A0A4T0VNI7_9PEZI|nr:Heat shock 70 kDa protein 12B [Colletotrichum higginsianum]
MYGHTLPDRTRPGLGSISLFDDEGSEKFVAVGIDFGTTYSGVSWARSTRPKELNEITGWSSEDPRNRRETQVPTLYDIDTGKWGYEITPDMVPMRWFKLLLLNDDDIQKEDIRNSPQLQQARQLLAQSTKRKRPVEIVGAYLEKIWNHTYATLKTMMDIEDLPLRVAITIPAIWPAYAQGLMREAAKIAGITKKRDIGETTLILVQEPEAAALASLFQHSSFPEIQKNESFIVCDAGGGTVDVISYKVTSERPFKLEECVPGDGKLAGAFQIDQAFEAHLRGKSKLKITSLSASDYNQFIQKEWELGAKRTFNNASEPRFFNLHPPSKAYGTMARLRHKETLAINKEEMKGFFSRSLTGIRSLVNSQYKQIEKATGKPPKKILLVGGLGSSEYVYDVLNDLFDNRVLRPSDRSRNHYGIMVDTPVETVDLEPEDEPYKDPEGGDKVDKASRIPITYHGFYQAPLPPKCTFDIMYSSEDVVPKRPGPKVMDLCRIECDWDKPIEEWKTVGNPYTGWRKHEDLELTMGLEGEPKWEIRVGSKRAEHNFEVQYMG